MATIKKINQIAAAYSVNTDTTKPANSDSAAKPSADKPRNTVQALIKQMEPEIKKALPALITPERFTRIALSAVSANPQLADCNPRSLLAALMTAAQLGLELNNGEQ